MMRYALLLFLLLGVGGPLSCARATSPAGYTRFANAEPVREVNDKSHVAKKPKTLDYNRFLYFFDGQLHRRATRWMEMKSHQRSEGVNSLGEVPNSTWFTNRIGAREMTAAEVRDGSTPSGSPMDFKPWTIIKSKVGGTAPGFLIKDTRGHTYLLKFDLPGVPEMETGADVVVSKILWAAGYNVPEDYVVSLARSDLQIAPNAKMKDALGGKKPLTEDFVDKQIAKVNVAADGSLRGLASQFLPGIPLGGWPRSGTRADDPNDVIAHTRRRDLRGMYALFSWLDHSDVKQDNTLDMWVTDEEDASRKYVRHYLVDFGLGIGVQAGRSNRIHFGYSYTLDPMHMLKSLASLGMWRRPWEGRSVPNLRGVGLFGYKNYKPGLWKPTSSSYYPFLERDRFDDFWGAKILIRFTRDQLEAVVGEANYSDPRASEYIVDVLVRRQRIAARHFFRQVDPLDAVEVSAVGERARVCFRDLALQYRLEGGETHYLAESFERGGTSTGWSAEGRPDADGRACFDDVIVATGNESYTVVSIDTRRAHLKGKGTLVHLARNTEGELRVIGIVRK